MAGVDNLIPGPKGNRLAGREMIIDAIADALLPDYEDDDLVRAEMGKAWDFVVTDDTRLHLAKKKAERAYLSIVSGVSEAVIDGDRVSINGFATFYAAEPNNLVDVMMYNGYPQPIFPDDEIVTEELTAEIADGAWVGVNKARYEYGGNQGLPYAAGNEGRDLFVNGSRYQVNSFDPRYSNIPMKSFEENKLKITATADDGAVRVYEIGTLVIEVLGHDERVYSADGSGEYVIEFVTDAEPGRVVTDEMLADLGVFGKWLPVRAGEYELLVARGLEGLSPRDIKCENYWGHPAEVLLQLYPRVQRVVRRWGGVHRIAQIPINEFWDRFAWRRAELETAGAWPSRSRNFDATVACDFRREFIDALQIVENVED